MPIVARGPIFPGSRPFAKKGGDPHKVRSRVWRAFSSAALTRWSMTSSTSGSLSAADPATKAALQAAQRQSRDRQRQSSLTSATHQIYSDGRWQRLAQQGAQTQRLLWASTGTKNKAYSDVLYVDELIGPDTVNTMPPATMDAYRDHGKPRPSLEEDVATAKNGHGRAAGGWNFN